jgi:hypothetical protein
MKEDGAVSLESLESRMRPYVERVDKAPLKEARESGR